VIGSLLDVKFNNGADGMSGKGIVLLGFSGIAVENVVFDSSVAELLAYTDLSLPVETSGDLSVVIKNGVQGEPYCQQLDGYLVWQDAQINSEMGNVDLDSAHINLSCDNGQIVADLQQQSEQLTTTANLVLKEKGIYQLQGLLKPGEQLEPAIREALSWVGVKNSAGDTILKFNGKL
jgi:general secretion pathway protein N